MSFSLCTPERYRAIDESCQACVQNIRTDFFFLIQTVDAVVLPLLCILELESWHLKPFPFGISTSLSLSRRVEEPFHRLVTERHGVTKVYYKQASRVQERGRLASDGPFWQGEERKGADLYLAKGANHLSSM